MGQFGKKPWAVLALLLLLVLAGWLFLGEENEENELLLPVQEAVTDEQPKPVETGFRAIAGTEEAAKAGELSNPFTMAHEKRHEAASRTVVAAPQEPDGKAAGQAASPASQPTVAVLVKPSQEPRLSGVLTGPGGKIAVLEYDGKSLSLGEGEGAEGLTVAAIESRRVLVRSSQGEKWLEMP